MGQTSMLVFLKLHTERYQLEQLSYMTSPTHADGETIGRYDDDDDDDDDGFSVGDGDDDEEVGDNEVDDDDVDNKL